MLHFALAALQMAANRLRFHQRIAKSDNVNVIHPSTYQMRDGNNIHSHGLITRPCGVLLV